MSRRYSNLDDLIHDLDATESLSDDPFGIAEFDDDDLAILGSFTPESRARRAPAKRPAKPKRKT
jgi:hypothetical protein